MKFAILGAATCAALLMAPVQGSAVTVVLDDFSIAQIAVDVPFDGVSNVSTIMFGGGTRTLTAENFTNNGNGTSATAMEVQSGSLSFSNRDQATGRGTVTYTNLGNLVLGPDPFFLFEVGAFDGIANFVATVTDGMGMVGMYEELLSGGFSPVLFFSEFDGMADFTDVAILSFSIDTFGLIDSVDGSLQAITISAVPVPAAGLLLVTGVGALAMLRRRKRA